MPRLNLRKTIFRECMKELRLYDTYSLQNGERVLVESASSDDEIQAVVDKTIERLSRRTRTSTEPKPTEVDQPKKF